MCSRKAIENFTKTTSVVRRDNIVATHTMYNIVTIALKVRPNIVSCHSIPLDRDAVGLRWINI